MSNLSLVEATLPPGFRFHPKDEELICDYLINKFSFSDTRMLVEIDLNKCEPWDLPETACVGGKEWYFYSQRDRKYATGLRTNRATVSGYWKATGKDRSIHRNKTLVGMRKTLVFYLGRAPKGKKTDWIMHEFRVEGFLEPQVDSSVKEDWVLCRVFCKNRETIGDHKQKSNIGSKYEGHEDTLSCSSSLPPLMDPFTLSFDQTQPITNLNNNNNNDNDNIFNQQQVPCFSSIFNPHIDLINNNHHLFSTIQPSLPLQTSSSSSHCYEKKDTDIKSILSRFNTMDENDNHFKGSSLSFSEGISDQSFLSDAALPVSMWYP